MRFGVHLPSAQAGADADGILHVAQRAEALGLDSVWMFDHLFTPTDLDSKYPYSRDGSYPMAADAPFFDPVGLYGVLAGKTERVRMGTAVLIGAYRNPIVLGKILASIERFAPGRLVLGIGAGWMREEFDALGVPFEKRGARMEEYVRALRAVWSGEPNAFEGEFYSWPESGFLPAPTEPIPIVIGGHGDMALRRAARLGDGWAVMTGRGQGSGIEAAGARIDLLNGFRAEEGSEGEPFELLYQQPLWFSDHPNVKLPLTGPPEEIAASIKRLQDHGVTTIDLMVFGPAPLIAETLERFAEEVLVLL